jgi:hypothetical protein
MAWDRGRNHDIDRVFTLSKKAYSSTPWLTTFNTMASRNALTIADTAQHQHCGSEIKQPSVEKTFELAVLGGYDNFVEIDIWRQPGT